VAGKPPFGVSKPVDDLIAKIVRAVERTTHSHSHEHSHSNLRPVT
jgi:hypothetical protein